MQINGFFKLLFAKHIADIAITAGREALREDITAALKEAAAAPQEPPPNRMALLLDAYQKNRKAFLVYKAETERLAQELEIEQQKVRDWNRWYESHVATQNITVTDEEIGQ